MKWAHLLIGLADLAVHEPERVDSLAGADIFLRNVLTAALFRSCVHYGPCAGGAVCSPAIADFIFMVPMQAMFITGQTLSKPSP